LKPSKIISLKIYIIYLFGEISAVRKRLILEKERKKGCHVLLWLIFSWLFNFVCAPKRKRKRKEKHPIVHWAHIVTRRQLDLVTGLIFKARKGGH
jgi:hypothetical protein